jgi:hypothetical protein
LTTQVFIEGNRLDLFDDENISITQGVQDVRDISKLFADFSQSFSVPASRNNNAIFKHYYNQDVDNGFDARTRKPAVININTIPFKTGKIQLNGVKITDNQPSSYKITFFGDVIKVKDLIGDDKLNSLDWLDNFNSVYSASQVLTGLTTGLDFTVGGVSYPKAVIYPLIAYKRQYLYDSDASDTTSTETLVNIAYDSGRTDGVNFKELKPAIKLSVIIESIQQKYAFNFTGGFFDSQIFKDIYVNLNKNTTSLATGLKEYENLTVANPYTNAVAGQIKYDTTIIPRAGFEDIEYKINLTLNGTVVVLSSYALTGTRTRGGVLSELPASITAVAQIITTDNFEFDASTNIRFEGIIAGSGYQTINLGSYPLGYTNQVIALQSDITNEIKDIKTYEFLTGLFKTFNLVVTSLNDDILVEDLPSWYTQGDIIDITPYVDTSKKDVDKGVLFNKINFEFKESEQVLADEFEQSNNRIFGNEELTLYTDETETEELDGTTLSVEAPFENPIFERLFDLNGNTLTTVQYCPYFNRTIQSISGNPFMFYVNPVNVTGNTLGYKGAGTSYSEISTQVLMPTHSNIINTDSFTLNFAAEFNEYTQSLNSDTIYSRFYSDYIGDVFSNKRRNYKYKAILPLSILNGLKLNDRLVIANTRYIINKITSNLINREDSLELINDIYDAPLVSDLLRSSLFTPNNQRFSDVASVGTAKYIGLKEQSAVKFDTGNGTAFLSIGSLGKSNIETVTFSITANTTGETRTVGIKVNDGVNNPIFYIIQTANLTADSTNITVDSTLITSDNG